ncbi:hypothetical protein V1512DRAFT_256025 [Lipomyces arxii]|uniref:uncharacterized protein n=1 Tax=Lipomyces arxii TaxID=56418 RepID=UPI0034CE0D6E
MSAHLGPGMSSSFPRAGPQAGSATAPPAMSDVDLASSSDASKLNKVKSTKQLNYEQYVTRDALQAAAFKDHTDRHIAFLRQKRQEIEHYEALRIVRQTNPGAIFGQGYAGFGNGMTSSKPGIIGARDRRRIGRFSRELKISRDDMRIQSEAEETLVPVRLDMEFEKQKLRDTFTWNLHERTISLELFAENLCEDYAFPLNHAPQIARAISEQVTEFQPHIFDPNMAKTVDPTLPYTAYKDDDMRVIIKLDITVGQHNLVDQFEWDINDPQNDPEEFAQIMCEDLCLEAEFLTAISHAIREQTQMFTRSLLLVGHPFDGRPVEDDEIRREMCSSVTELIRPKNLLREFTPVLYELSEAELGKADKDSERENRWKRRQGRTVGRRGGIVLPDLREPMRAFRTPILSSVLPGAVERTKPEPVQTMLDEVEVTHSNRRTRFNTGPGAAASHHAHANTRAQTPVATPAAVPRSPSPGPDGRLMVTLKGRKLKMWMISNASRFR